MSEKDDFFVGYLASPASLTRLFKVVFPLLVLVALGMAAWFASGQKSAGQGVWDLSVQKEVSGYLTVDPYPVLHFVGENSKSVILVQQGKKSATAMSAPFADKWVSVSGYAIDRGDWSMLELTTSSVFKEVVGGASTNKYHVAWSGFSARQNYRLQMFSGRDETRLWKGTQGLCSHVFAGWYAAYACC